MSPRDASRRLRRACKTETAHRKAKFREDLTPPGRRERCPFWFVHVEMLVHRAVRSVEEQLVYCFRAFRSSTTRNPPHARKWLLRWPSVHRPGMSPYKDLAGATARRHASVRYGRLSPAATLAVPRPGQRQSFPTRAGKRGFEDSFAFLDIPWDATMLAGN